MCFNYEVYAKIDVHMKTYLMMQDRIFYQRSKNAFAIYYTHNSGHRNFTIHCFNHIF